jgi:large subunit ribosomal protein L1
MAISKKRKAVNAKVDKNKVYTLKDASTLVKEVNVTKFDASVDLHIRLGVDPKKADQAVRGTVTLPHGTGKTKKVLVLCTPIKKKQQEQQVLILLDWTNSLQKLKVAGLMLMLS